uniref:PDZ domain-containing protein n=1 Tax=Guillardia theta TaxID=55529 RepID=A0A7S4JPY7_GUITH|mmetsp:Transcript_17859/g.58708  ORF Transcript_17859/g.58708 Transcript_17859/m.58708 type:complete len:517 (+) Transcript_17859:117-1667(+)
MLASLKPAAPLHPPAFTPTAWRPSLEGLNSRFTHPTRRRGVCSLHMCRRKVSTLRRDIGAILILLSALSSLNFSQFWISSFLADRELTTLQAAISSDCTLMQSTRDILQANFVDWTGRSRNIQQLATCRAEGTLTDRQMIDGDTLSDVLRRLDDKYTRLVSETEMKTMMRQFDNLGAGMVLSTMTVGEKGADRVESCAGGDLFVGYTTRDQDGLRRGDQVVGINGRDMRCRSRFEAAELLQTSSGMMELEVIREGKSVQNNLLLPQRSSVFATRLKTRRAAPLYHEVKQVKGRKVAYVKVPQFTAGVARSFDAALAEVEGQDVEALVLDVRGNKGGLVFEAQQIAGLVHGEGKPFVRVIGKGGRSWMLKTEGLVDKRSDLLASDIPVVVLVDEESASASEFLAVSLREERNAKVYGKKTFGKALVQGLFSLPQGRGHMFITVAEVKAPRTGIMWQGKGLDPDSVVDFLLPSFLPYVPTLDFDSLHAEAKIDRREDVSPSLSSFSCSTFWACGWDER